MVFLGRAIGVLFVVPMYSLYVLLGNSLTKHVTINAVQPNCRSQKGSQIFSGFRKLFISESFTPLPHLRICFRCQFLPLEAGILVRIVE